MEQRPSDENVDDDEAAGDTPTPDPVESENEDPNDAPDETPPPVDGSEPEPENSPDGVSADVPPEEEESAEPEESSEEVQTEEPMEEAASSEVEILEEASDEVPVQEEVEQEEALDEVVVDAGPSDGEVEEDNVVDTIIDEIVKDSEGELDQSDSQRLITLAEDILSEIISTSVMSSAGDLEPEAGAAEEAEVIEEEDTPESDNFGVGPAPRQVKMVDKAVQANAKEIDEALEVVSTESLPIESEQVSAVSSVISEGEVYQSCDEEEEMPCGGGEGMAPCPYRKEGGAETADLEVTDTDDENQWEDLPDDGKEITPDSSVRTEPQVTSLPEDAYSPSAPPEDSTPTPSAVPDTVKRSESAGGIKPAPPPPDSYKPRAVVSDTKRSAAGQSAVTPKPAVVRRESEEETSDWFSKLADDFWESPYVYIGKFVAMCIVIRAMRSVLISMRCE